MALATSFPRESLARCSRIQASRLATSGALSSCRTALRLSGLCPLNINNATRPAYQSADAHVLAPANFDPIARDPAFQAPVHRLRGDEGLGRVFEHQSRQFDRSTP
jgi:hypothetical protein